MTELAPLTGLLDVASGEILPATVGNAAQVLRACREKKELINRVIEETTAFLASEAAHQGTKTLRQDGEQITLNGGASTEYDAHDLAEALRKAGCPEDRIDQAVKAEISYKVDRAVLRQLAAANPDYRAAIDLAAREVEKPYRASVALRRETS